MSIKCVTNSPLTEEQLKYSNNAWFHSNQAYLYEKLKQTIQRFGLILHEILVHIVDV